LGNSAQRKSLKNIAEGEDAFDPESGVLPIGRPPNFTFVLFLLCHAGFTWAKLTSLSPLSSSDYR